MAEQQPHPVQPTESMLALSFLREDIQDVRQDVRQTNERIDEARTEMSGRVNELRIEMNTCIDDLRTEMSGRIDELRAEMNTRIDDLRTEMSGRIDQTNERIDEARAEMNTRIDDLAKQLDSRYARLMAMLIACTSILVTALGAAVAVLK